MQEILFGYKLNPITWAYISSLMMIGIYFKFHRFWSVRNLDLVLLICFSPGLLLLYYGLSQTASAAIPPEHIVRAGYVWLFTISGIFLFRLLLDPLMVRRPLLEPNLSASGLTFTGLSLLVFLMANVLTATTNAPHRAHERLEDLVPKQASSAWLLPGFAFFHEFAGTAPETATAPPENPPPPPRVTLLHAASTRVAVILAHLAVVAGMVWIGYRHFDNIHTGVAAATLYLLSFYTSQFTGQVDHIVPAMLLVWAVAAYRRPVVSGLLLGSAAGMIYYPLFLLPLWCGFYWRRGVVRFLCGIVLALAVMVGCLALLSPDFATFADQFQQMFGLRNPYQTKPTGFWEFFEPAIRIPLLAAFLALCAGLALWPARKNFGMLLSGSAAVMLAAQFWLAYQGGLYMAWYLPLLILTMFRPNLEDRVALSAVRDLWIPWRRKAG